MKKRIAALLTCMLLMNVSLSETAVTYTDREVQLDLSPMSGTMVYSMIYNIMSDYTAYLGQVIRLAGYYSVWEDTDTGMRYHSCVIPDATACCEQGLEFVWSGEHAYPEDYPAVGTDILVTGRLESYKEGTYLYLHLVDAEVRWEK